MIATTTERLIAQHIARWEAEELRWKGARRPGRGYVGTLAYGPYLLLAREEGTDAHEVARRVAARLGWHVFDREIVDEIAHDAHVRSRLVDRFEARDRAALEEIIFSMFGEPTISTGSYLTHLNHIIHALGLRGDVVIVGRGARYILPSQFGLSVRLVAPFETRVQRVAARDAITLKEARQKIEQMDLARAKFIHLHFHQDVNDPLGYELTINTVSITTEVASEIILRALEQKLGTSPQLTPGKTPTTANYPVEMPRIMKATPSL